MIDFDRLMIVQQEMLRGVTEGLPDTWREFTLTVEITADGQRIRLNGPTLAALPDDAYEPLRAIQLIHAAGGHPLRGFKYDFVKNADDTWGAAGEFEYVNP